MGFLFTFTVRPSTGKETGHRTRTGRGKERMNMKRIGRLSLMVALIALVAGCQSEAFRKSILARANTLRTSPEYVIGEGDNVTVMVLGHEEYDTTNDIRPDGKLAFPEYGDIVMAGKTPEEVRAELQESFKSTLGLKSPKVYVAVNTFRSKFVTVLGEIRAPGRYPYTGQMRVVDLMGLAIGPSFRSAPSQALLFREVDGVTRMYQVHLNDFFERGDFTTNFYVRPGDILFVPKNGFAAVADWIRMVTEPLRAVFEIIGLGGRTISVYTGSLSGF